MGFIKPEAQFVRSLGIKPHVLLLWLFWNSSSVCVDLSQNKCALFVFMAMEQTWRPVATVWLNYVFAIVFGKTLSSMTQWDEIYTCARPGWTLVSVDTFIVGLSLHTEKKNIEYHRMDPSFVIITFSFLLV